MFNAAFTIMQSYQLESTNDAWEKVALDNSLQKIPILSWMWEQKYWKPRELDPGLKEEFCARLVAEARKKSPEKSLSREDVDLVNSVSTEVDVRKCIELFDS